MRQNGAGGSGMSSSAGSRRGTARAAAGVTATGATTGVAGDAGAGLRRRFGLSLLGFRCYVVALFLIGIILELRVILSENGRLFYTLDDPYIHLAVAEMLLRGGFGINLHEFASPSSSILFAPLLALGLEMGLGDAAPFLVNAVAGSFLAWILAGFAWRLTGWSNTAKALALLLAPCLVLGTNAIPLAMTGMEHLAHAALSVAAIAGFATLQKGRPLPPGLWIGLVFAPLLRFEGLALALAGLVALMLIGRGRQALLIGLMLFLALFAYVMAMTALGLPPLPSSVLVKSGVAASAVDGAGSIFVKLCAHLVMSLSRAPGMLVAALALIAAFGAMMARPVRQGERAALWLVVAALSAHLLAGEYSSFWRYEPYAVAMGLLGLLIVLGILLRGGHLGPVPVMVFALLGCLPAVTRYFPPVVLTPGGAENVQLQQYQMHRFVTEFFRHPVAVNDLGWVSWRNDLYVLDLVGLGSERMRRLAAEGNRDAAQVQRVSAEYGVKFAMIYDLWLGKVVPEDWCKMAVLTTPQVTAGSPEVSFYLLDPTLKDQMNAALDQFRKTLPGRDRLDRFACADD